jgi:hypothetical protein
MLSIDLHDAVERMLGSPRPYEHLLMAVKTIAEHYETSTEYIVGHSEGGDKLNQAASALQSKFTSFPSVTQSISPSKVYKAVDAFRAELARDFEGPALSHPWLTSLADSLDSFVKAYDDYLTRQTASNAANLMVIGHRLDQRLDSFFGSLAFYKEIVETP